MYTEWKEACFFVLFCACTLAFEHLLTECVDLIEWRRQFFKTESLKMLFPECSQANIIQFLKQISLFDKL